MIHLLETSQHDLVSPDGKLIEYTLLSDRSAKGVVEIREIAPAFLGFSIDPGLVRFNLKSALAQLGLNASGIHYELNPTASSARIELQFNAYGSLARELLRLLPVGAFVGKLFAADDRRRVREPFYLTRMFGRADREGSPLLSLGGLHGSKDLILDKVDGRAVAYLSLLNGKYIYDDSMFHFLPTLTKAMLSGRSIREWVGLHQVWIPDAERVVSEEEILLVRTLPLHIRTVFASVCEDLLPEGCYHTSADILQPDTAASGDVYELFGSSDREITDIPLEFYTLDPFREHVFFSDRDQLQSALESGEALFKAFETAPPPKEARAATFVVKGDQLLNLKPDDWIVRDSKMQQFPGFHQYERQALMVERYIEQQPIYPFLELIERGEITSQGILLTRYFPSPLMKRVLLSPHVQRCLKAIYFEEPSLAFQEFFSSEDRALLHDLEKFGIPVYWVDKRSHKVLSYIEKPGKDSGMFVPVNMVESFVKSTIFGIYGSNLTEGDFEHELKELLEGILKMKKELKHPLLNSSTPIALLTGGGPGVMELGNRIAKEVGILSCANIVDFRQKGGSIVNEQNQNSYIDAKMTYRIDKLVERQAEFNLDFPIFLIGGIGTDFEQALEEVRRKVGASGATPILLFGTAEYWKAKITSRFQCNLANGTIKGSEWISNCFYSVQNAQEGLEVYRAFFSDRLAIGKHGPVYEPGFAIASELFCLK